MVAGAVVQRAVSRVVVRAVSGVVVRPRAAASEGEHGGARQAAAAPHQLAALHVLPYHLLRRVDGGVHRGLRGQVHSVEVDLRAGGGGG